MWAAADDVPKTLVRTLGKFVKLMHGQQPNRQSSKGVSLRLQHTAHVQASGTQVWRRQIKPSWMYKALTVKFNDMNYDFISERAN